jgi:hypothetical protein
MHHEWDAGEVITGVTMGVAVVLLVTGQKQRPE